MTDLGLRPLVPTLYQLAESPVYDDRSHRLVFCDIVDNAVHAVDLATGEDRVWRFPSLVASLGLAESGKIVVALKDSVILFDPETGTSKTLASVEADKPSTRLNDGKVGPDGAFWVGTINEAADRAPIGGLYRVDAAGHVELKVDGIKCSNGLAFTADGRTMFHTDTRGPWIDRWDFDPATGAISGRTRIATPDDATGRPDGGAADVEGYYWSSGVSAARLNRYAPDGTLVESYPVPAAAPTMPAFGGPDMKTLFVTSLRQGRSAEQLAQYPLSGSVFIGAAPVAGVKVSRFRDI
ncbi:SMP-30/gluconolactonase/LRE family protein [Kaistia dalseonensis]|uniref:Sugar lactone lactonase YvrE n=1 Tax=Kaistia dalseonensis TaxID=410840 RepID=A0ABU0H0W7_9HYPH|nr:SMP-30/gluconolactonase/LRE family protein [Kaistia dalseonensis]MCX5493394.1 SMP-30/gluconolactonase/LRE family protein [Kaistia dalseonensis]MDQ0435952.1 sugar lactone lactonase YvrE [Kaistia dalseonensis]